MILMKCAEPGCNAVQETTRCKQHKRTEANIRKKADPFYKRVKWLKLREYILAIQPYCQECMRNNRKKPADVVDHIKPRKTHPELELDSDNMQSLCFRCHQIKTNKGL